MDYERTHRSGELFICFTSRPSSNSSSSFTKVSSSKSIRSPSHNDKSREPSTLSISSSLNNRRLLRGNNGSIKAGQFSPMMFPTGSSKKRGCSFETPEPSSPKVTCIGQVRVKTKKRGKKILARKKRTAEVGFRNIDRTSSQEGLLNHHQQQHHQHSCLPYRNQKWVHFPLTICETLRSFGADLNCFLPCGGDGNRASVSDRDGEEKRKNTSEDGETTGGGSCGPFLDRWLMAFQEGEVQQKKTSEQVIEMMYGDEVDEEEIRERVNIMKMMEDVGNCKEEDDFEKGRLSMCLGNDFEKGRLSMCLGDDDLEKGRGSVCLPPKNALLLMRCRSDPLRMSSLSRFWDSAVAKEDDNEDEFEDGVSEVDEEEGEEEDDEAEEEEAMSSELDEECEVKECLEKGVGDESQAGGNQEDPSKLEEIVTSIPAHDPQGEKDEEKQKSASGLELSEEITSNGDTVIIEENPAAEAQQPILQEVEKNHELEEHNVEAGEDPRTREQDLVLQEVEDQEVKHTSEAGDDPITEEQTSFQEIEDVQKVGLNKVYVENSEIEDVMLQEVQGNQIVGSNTESVENLAETFMLRANEDQEVDCNTGSAENLKTEEECRLQAVGGEHYTDAIENPITEEEEIVFQEMVQPGIEEAEEREMRPFEMFVEPHIEEPTLVTAEGDQAILDLQEERLVGSPFEEKGIEDITQDQENEKEIAEEACSIPVASEEQEAKIHEDNEGCGEEKSSSTNEEGEAVVRQEQEAQKGNDSEECEAKSSEACAIPVASEEQEAQTHEDNERCGEEKASSTNEEGEAVVRQEQEAQKGNDSEECEEKSSLADGKGETERKPAVLPECMMWMMMSEPKLSMEVSKETWVCSGDFTRKSECHGRVADNSEARQPQLALNNKLTDYMGNHPIIQQRQQRRLPTSCANNNRDPARRVVLSMASMIEQKLMKAVAYHQPFVLSRCNSEPVRSSAKLGSEYKMFLNYQ